MVVIGPHSCLSIVLVGAVNIGECMLSSVDSYKTHLLLYRMPSPSIQHLPSS